MTAYINVNRKAIWIFFNVRTDNFIYLKKEKRLTEL